MLRGRKRSEARPVTLYTRPGCHLCTKVQEGLAPYVQRGTITLAVVDLSGDAALEARFGQSIPVLESEGRVFAKGRIDISTAINRLLRRETA